MKVAVTGGTGSLGNALTEALLPVASRIVILSRDELKQAEMAERHRDHAAMRFFLGDVRDHARLVEAFWGLDVVVAAAAMKRVDSVSYNPHETVQTNVIGVMNTIRAAVEAGVKKVVVISSDKAVHAQNIYGASKFLAEGYAIAANSYAQPRGTQVSVLRYGNVANSRGSVISLWRQRKAAGLPLTITDKRMTRFWITLPEAANLVLSTITYMRGGEVVVPHLPAFDVIDLAAAIAGPDHPIDILGQRRAGGEKLAEQMVSDEEATRTTSDVFGTTPVFVIAPSFCSWPAEWSASDLPESFRYVSDTWTPRLSMDDLSRAMEII